MKARKCVFLVISSKKLFSLVFMINITLNIIIKFNILIICEILGKILLITLMTLISVDSVKQHTPVGVSRSGVWPR